MIFFEKIKAGFNLNFFKRLFQRTALGRLLNQDKTPRLINFFDAYLSSWWWTRLYFRSLLQDTKTRNEFKNLVDLLNKLKSTNNYNHYTILIAAKLCANVESNIIEECTSKLSEQVTILKKAGITDEENITFLTEHGTRVYLVTKDYLAYHTFAQALIELNNAKILSKETKAVLATRTKIFPLCWSLKLLSKLETISKENVAILTNHKNDELVEGILLQFSYESRLYTTVRLNNILSHQKPEELFKGLYLLNLLKILTPEIETSLNNNANPEELALAFEKMHRAKLLTIENEDFIVENHHNSNLLHVIELLGNKEILGTANFNALKQIDASLLNNIARIPKEQFSQPVFTSYFTPVILNASTSNKLMRIDKILSDNTNDEPMSLRI